MREFLLKYWNEYSLLLPKLGLRLLFAILIILAGKIISKAAEKMIQKAVKSSKMKIDETLGSVLHLAVNYGIVIIGAILILDNFGFNTTSLIALLGAAGVTIGLALRNTLSNIASGIILLFLRPFKIGDYIEFGPTSGTVKEIGLFASVIEAGGDGVYISVPNSNLWGPPVKNYTRSKRFRMDLPVTIPNDAPLDAAIALMEEIGQKEKRFLKSPPPQVFIRTGDENGITLVLRAWAPRDIFAKVSQDMPPIIKKRIEAAGLNSKAGAS
jgi:small conductance mechanosensitive channel